MTAPRVSVIIAAHQAQDFIAEAIESALRQPVPLEIVVAPDEPAADYSGLAARDSRITVLPPVAQATGPGPARNRALAAARGAFIAVLDADDLWSPDYLAELLPLAEATGVAFGRTSITDWAGREIRAVTARDGMADYAVFATAFASYHGIVRRDATRCWRDELAEDVLFDLESLALAGGRAPYADGAVYQLRQRPSSMTQGGAFLRDIAAGYDRLIDLVSRGETAVPPREHAAVVRVFRHWADMNHRFVASGAENYQLFVTEILNQATQEQNPGAAD
jgi:glycosyltransferase involved in cell wall biosynthesis